MNPSSLEHAIIGTILASALVVLCNHELCVSSNAFTIANSHDYGEKIESFKELNVGIVTNFILHFQ